MRPRYGRVLSRLDRIVARFWMAVLALSLLCVPARVQAQTNDCSGYAGCTALSTASNSKLQGPITFSFNDTALASVFPTQAARDDFKSRTRTAAADWAQKTGVSITEAPSGQAGNVTITASSDSHIQDVDGEVSTDPANSNRRIITYSSEFSAWSSAGRDRMASHELGRILGLRDVPSDGCPGVQTVMRQNGPGSIAADLQLRNGYTCEAMSNTTVGDPNGCPANTKLMQPMRPNPCDSAKVTEFQCPAGGNCGDGGGGDGGSDPGCHWVYDCTQFCYTYDECTAYDDCGDCYWYTTYYTCDPPECTSDCVY